jgi:hypothetical protein
MSVQTTALILAWVAIGLLGLAMSGLVRQIHALAAGQRVAGFALGPAIGSPAPELGGNGKVWTRPTALLFVDDNCPSCAELLPEFATLAESTNGAGFAAVFPGSATGFTSSVVQALEGQEAAFERFRIPATPFGVVVGADGLVVAAEPIGSAAALRALVERVKGGAVA